MFFHINTELCFCFFYRESLAFATEPVFASLANILGYQENMPVPPPKALKEFDLFDIEIKYGFLQVLFFIIYDLFIIHFLALFDTN